MAKLIWTTNVPQTLSRLQKIEQHEPHIKFGVNLSTVEKSP